MTGPEHYLEAERLVELAASEDDYILLLKAKVHATLALTAAQVDSAEALNAIGTVLETHTIAVTVQS